MYQMPIVSSLRLKDNRYQMPSFDTFLLSNRYQQYLSHMLHVWIFAYYFAFIYRCMFQLEPFFKAWFVVFQAKSWKNLGKPPPNRSLTGNHSNSWRLGIATRGETSPTKTHVTLRESGSVQLPKRIFERKNVGSFLWWVISNKHLRIQDSGICTRGFLGGFMSRRCLLSPLGFLIAPFFGMDLPR